MSDSMAEILARMDHVQGQGRDAAGLVEVHITREGLIGDIRFGPNFGQVEVAAMGLAVRQAESGARGDVDHQLRELSDELRNPGGGGIDA